jgi:uncharacterized membrane protein
MDFKNDQLNSSAVNNPIGSSSGPTTVNSNNPFQSVAQSTQSTAQDTVPTPSDSSSTTQAKLQNAKDTIYNSEVCFSPLPEVNELI